MHHAQQVARGRFPPLQRVEIEQLACCAPAGIGLEITHWSTRSLARVAAERGIVPRIAHSTVSLLLRHADLQPHRWRYWKHPRSMLSFVSGRQACFGVTSRSLPWRLVKR